jgi:pimeloyl-ACP methyl ester carboxylesterase
MLAVGLAMGLLAGCGPSRSLGAAADPYARPGRLVTLDDGRTLNLRCRGRGTPTVLLEAGWGAASQAWEKVQPALSRTTRVCAYDRAGYGFSAPGPLPRDGATIVRDLGQALAKAGERGPYVVVGHSAGALYGRLFAARAPKEVAGLVLLDPTVEQRAAQPSGDGLDGIRRRIQRCLAASEAGLAPTAGDPQWSGCIPAKPNEHDLANARRPDLWRNQLSELDNIFGRTSDQVIRIGPALRSIPIYVITASESAAAAPVVGSDPPQALLELRHQMVAASSRDGSQRTVVSSHLVMVERPDVVISAVEEMIRAKRAGRLPEPLPPSETSQAPAEDAFRERDDTPFKGLAFPESPVPTK